MSSIISVTLISSLEDYVFKYSKSGGVKFPEIKNIPDVSKKQVIKKISGYTFLGIFLAGLLDGVNPCAFATLIFFISYLLLLNFSKTNILKAGITFIIISFLVYFLIGLGLLKAVHELTVIKYFSDILFKSTGVILIILSIISFYDYFLYKKNKTMILQLSSWQKLFIHKVIREKIKGKNLIICSMIIAAFISLAEFTCTGQIYLPTIMYAVKTKVKYFWSLSLLIIYNLAFIIPLCFIFGLVYRGATDKSISKYFQKSTGTIKILFGMTFLIFGIVLLY